MGAVTDPTADGVAGKAKMETLSEDSPNPNLESGSNGVHEVRATDGPGNGPGNGTGRSEGVVPDGIEFSPAPAHVRRHSGGPGLFSFLSGGIHRGASGSMAIPRGGSGGIPRQGSGGISRHGSGGIHRHGSGSVAGGIHRARSGVHLPSLPSLTFAMSRLPEEDAGLQMHLTETREVEISPESPVHTDGDDPAAPRKPRNRMRKHLTAVGACSFGFRLAECVLSLISFIVMCANSQHVGAGFGTLKFNHFQAYRYLVAVNIIVFVYSTVQFIQLTYTVILGMSFIPSIILSTWLTFGFDQFFSYLLLSASSSAATVANISYTGEMGARLCTRFDLDSFCARADAAVTMSFFTFLAMLSSTILAIYRVAVLLREY